jgi:pimeloyl-ACP methyl ester carboxylesterase
MSGRGRIELAAAGVGLLAAARHRREITVPTLVVHAEDDALSPYRDSRAMAERIPGARIVTVPRGGHTLTHLDPTARRAVEQFIDTAYAPAPILAVAFTFQSGGG